MDYLVQAEGLRVVPRRAEHEGSVRHLRDVRVVAVRLALVLSKIRRIRLLRLDAENKRK